MTTGFGSGCCICRSGVVYAVVVKEVVVVAALLVVVILKVALQSRDDG